MDALVPVLSDSADRAEVVDAHAQQLGRQSDRRLVVVSEEEPLAWLSFHRFGPVTHNCLGDRVVGLFLASIDLYAVGYRISGAVLALCWNIQHTR